MPALKNTVFAASNPSISTRRGQREWEKKYIVFRHKKSSNSKVNLRPKFPIFAAIIEFQNNCEYIIIISIWNSQNLSKVTPYSIVHTY